MSEFDQIARTCVRPVQGAADPGTDPIEGHREWPSEILRGPSVLKKPVSHEPVPHFVLFWGLACLGVAAAVPCMLVPPIEALQKLAVAESRLEHRIAVLNRHAERQRAVKHALRTDPQVNRRIALRDFSYRDTGQVEFVQASQQASWAAHDLPAPRPPTIPHWVSALYPQQVAAVYRNSISRHIVLVLSIGMLVFGVCAYGPAHMGRTESQQLA